MKKISLCIGCFVVLFLAVGIYTAHAQGDLRLFDGTWLQMTMKIQKRVEFIGSDSTATPEKINNSSQKVYACMNVEQTAEANEYALLTFFDREGTAIGYADFYWDAGTDLDFVAWMSTYTVTDVTYVAADYGPTDTFTYGPVRVTGKAIDKVKVQSMGGTYGWLQASTVTETTGDYSVFGVTINGFSTTGKNIPAAACGWETLSPF